jgi:adenylosuccinate lyase
MVAIWAEDNKFKIWLEIETLVAEAQASLGIIPQSAAEAIRQKGRFTPSRIAEIEQETRHDVLAFLTNVSREVGEEARFLHQGLTSSDILDTCLALQLKQAADILLDDLKELLEALKRRALEHEKTICIGRTHGVHAEPTSFGLKLLGHHAAFKRHQQRLKAARAEISTCKLSGAVGTYASIDPRVEKIVARQLGLQPETVATQVIPRDRHAVFFTTLGLIASSIENLAIEIRHLSRTEVREVQEPFAQGQKGSSAMPHKKNPILSENLTGLARLVRAAVIPSLENVALWHERDISHSSVERVIAPDTTITLDFALSRLTGLIDDLVVYPERMKANLEAQGGLHFSQGVLLALTQAGMSREEAYKIVQQESLYVWENGGSLKERVKQLLPEEQLEKIFDSERYLSNITLGSSLRASRSSLGFVDCRGVKTPRNDDNVEF